MYEVIYLTGAPAAGKSSLTRKLAELIPNLGIFEFGQRLTEYLKATEGEDFRQADLRRLSSNVSTTEAVRAVDADLIRFCEEQRSKAPIVIDSHPVTKEPYGFRVTAYSFEQVRRLKPTQLWMVYTSPEVALARIQADASGRPTISTEEARMHTQLQASVILSYSMALGIPAYLFDADTDQDTLASSLAARIVPRPTEQVPVYK